MIAAGIVTYEPELDRLIENVRSIAPQVTRVVVFDNGSSNVAEIEALIDEIGHATLVQASENVGIASALNRICELLGDEGHEWVVTLDQDSVAPRGMVSELLAAAGQSGAAMVTPFIVDRNKLSFEEYRQLELPAYDRYRQAARKGAITSGELVRLDTWRQVGGFDDNFFIDYVDYDFNQRVLLAGFEIVRANRTYLLHEVGRARPTWLWVPRKALDGSWGLERFYSFGHSPMRCYYKARNRVLFTRKYWREIGITHEGVWQIPQQIVLTVLFERDRWRKLTAFMRGIWDGMRTPLERGTGAV